MDHAAASNYSRNCFAFETNWLLDYKYQIGMRRTLGQESIELFLTLV